MRCLTVLRQAKRRIQKPLVTCIRIFRSFQSLAIQRRRGVDISLFQEHGPAKRHQGLTAIGGSGIACERLSLQGDGVVMGHTCQAGQSRTLENETLDPVEGRPLVKRLVDRVQGVIRSAFAHRPFRGDQPVEHLRRRRFDGVDVLSGDRVLCLGKMPGRTRHVAELYERNATGRRLIGHRQRQRRLDRLLGASQPLQHGQ